MSVAASTSGDSAISKYYESIGMRPYAYEDNPQRKARWEWLMGDVGKTMLEANGRKPTAHRVDYARIATEIMLENTMKWIAIEECKDQRMLLLEPEKFYEEINTTAIVPFTRHALPIVRRVVPRLYAKSLVGFQPMPMPTSKVFWLNFLYGTEKYPTAVGDRVDLILKMNRNYGGARTYDVFTGDAATTVFNLSNYGAVPSTVAVFLNGVKQTSGYTHAAGGTAASPDTVTFGAAPGNGVAILIVYDQIAEGATARDIDMGMESDDVTAEAIKLRSAMTVETMQDFMAYHGLASEAELTTAMSDELDRQVDWQILDRLYKFAAAGNTNWDSSGYLAGDDNTFFRRAYRKTLYEAIVATNNLIFKKQYLNAAWIVGGVGAIERLEQLEEFKINQSMDAPYDAGVARVYEGTLGGKWQIYKDPRMPDNKLLFGYSGSSPFHQGAVFMPYIPMYMTDLLPDPNINFKVRKGFMSRFAFKIVIPACYATLTIL